MNENDKIIDPTSQDVQQETQIVESKDEKKTVSKEYDGSRHPMVTMHMLKTSSAIKNAQNRILIRRDWAKGRLGELKIQFNSDDPVIKKTAYVEANAIIESTFKLAKAEAELKIKLPAILEREREQVAGLEFPELDS